MSEKIPYKDIIDRIKDDVDYIADEAYTKGYTDGRKQAKTQAELDVAHDIENVAKGNYQKGLEDAWEVAKKIVISKEYGGMGVDDRLSAFGDHLYLRILRDWSITEVMEKMAEWGKKHKEINVGDEIWDKDGECKAVVMDEGNDGDIIVVLTENGCVEEWERCEVSKSGKHHDEVVRLVEKLRMEE